MCVAQGGREQSPHSRQFGNAGAAEWERDQSNQARGNSKAQENLRNTSEILRTTFTILRTTLEIIRKPLEVLRKTLEIPRKTFDGLEQL